MLSQRIDMRRTNERIAIRTHMVSTMLVCNDQQKIGTRDRGAKVIGELQKIARLVAIRAYRL